jgi:hypothetical protein
MAVGMLKQALIIKVPRPTCAGLTGGADKILDYRAAVQVRVRGPHSSSSALSEVGKAHQGDHQTSGSVCTIADFDSGLPRLPPIGGMASARALRIGGRYMSFHVAVRSGSGYVHRFPEKPFALIFLRTSQVHRVFKPAIARLSSVKESGQAWRCTCLELRRAVR